MKRIKYLLAGVLMLATSAQSFAQEVSYQEAIKPIQQAMNADPTNPEAAKDLVKEYKKEYKKDADALVSLGTVYLLNHHFDKATELANMVINNKKMNQSSAYVLLGDIAAVQDSVGNAGAAAAQYQTAISVDPTNVEAYVRYARVYRHVNPTVAIGKLEELKKIKPDYPLEVTAADILMGDGKYAEAAKWLEKANASTFDETGFYKYAVAEYYSGQNQKALDAVEQGLAKFNKSEYISRIGVMAANKLKNYTKALEYAENVMSGKEKKTANDYYEYGEALCGNGKYQEAIDAFNKSLELDPDNTEPLSKLAIAYNGLGDTQKALDYSRQYLEKGKNVTTDDWVNLANIYVKKGDDATDAAQKKANYNQAMDIYEQMTEKFPSLKDWCWISEASIAYGKLKDSEKSGELYKKIVDFEEAKSTQDATTTSYLKAAYLFLGYNAATKKDVAKATEYFTKLQKIDPTNETAKNYLDQVKAYNEGNNSTETEAPAE